MPELLIHKAVSQSGLWRFAESDRTFTSPYWAHWWGGGLALARYILDHRETVAGRRVLDLGAGSGMVAIAAARSGAGAVTAADIDRYAIAAIELNAAANNVSVATRVDDVLAGPPPAVDLVLVGDLFYDRELACRVSAFLTRCRRSGIDVLIGDPLRAFLPRERLELIAEYPGPDFGTGAAETARNTVFAFRG